MSQKFLDLDTGLPRLWEKITSKISTSNAASATKLATARTIQTNLASTSAASFDGAANVAPGVTGTLAIGNGGTGATTQSGAFNNIVAPGGTITGPIKAKGTLSIANNTDNAFLSFVPTNLGTDAMGRIYYYSVPSKTNSYFEFHQFSRSSSDYSRINACEVYQFPTADADKTATSYYKIITTKNLSDADSRFVKKSGDRMTGELGMKNVSVGFRNSSTDALTAEFFYMTNSTTYSNFRFRQYSKTSNTDDTPLSTFEEYQLPNADYGRSDNKYYTIATNKNPELLDGRWLSLSGGTLTGSTNFKSDLYVSNSARFPAIRFQLNDNTTTAGVIYYDIGSETGISSPYFFFRHWSPTTDGSTTLTQYYEDFKLPVTEASLTSSSAYSILTSKNAVTITQGGTGATNVIDARSNLLYLGNNPITSTSNDTTANWQKGGFSLGYFSSTGCLTDQPSQWGLVLNANAGNEVHQIWMQQSSGNLFHRGGNASGWNGTWKTILDSSNYSSYSLPLTGGALTGALVLNSHLIIKNSNQFPQISFQSTAFTVSGGNTTPGLIYFNTGSATGLSNPKFFFRVWSPTTAGGTTLTSYYEDYYFPAVDTNRTSSTSYNIYSSKNPSQIFNDLSTASAVPVGEDYYICQAAGGGTTYTTYYRRPTSTLWSYINDKLGTSTIGSSTQPVYWNGSKTVACGAVGIANGGTGATTAAQARVNLGITSTTSQFVYHSGNIVASTTQPSNPTTGMIWLELEG